MAIKVFNKTLAASGSNNIATSQSVGAGANFVLNGSTTPYLSTTSSAAAAVSAVVIPMTSTTGVVVGCVISDSTASTAFVTGTQVVAVSSTSVTVWPPVAGAVGVGSGDTIVFTGPAIIDTASSTNDAIGRRVALAYTGTSAFTIVGTNAYGNVITDTLASAASSNQSNLDFVTVTKITAASSITVATAGTNGVGSSPWWTTNFYSNNDVNIGLDVEIVTGSVNYSIQHTYDDPNNLFDSITYPEAFNHPVLNQQNASLDGSYTTPIAAARVLINSGTGQLRVRFLQSGIG